MSQKENDPKPKNGKKAKDTVEEEEIFTAPVITREPVSKQVYLGQKISLRITATGKPVPSYQWYLNGRKVSGATSDRFIVNKSRRDQAGAYTCEAKNFVGSAMSRAAMITFLTMKVPELKITLSSGKNQMKLGDSCKLVVSSPTRDILKKFEFRWLFNGRRIKDATEHELSFTSFKPKYAGEYKIMIIHGGELYSSNVIKLTCASDELPISEELKSKEEENILSSPEDTKKNFFFDPLDDSGSEDVNSSESMESLAASSPIAEEGITPLESNFEEAREPSTKKQSKVILLQKLLARLEKKKNSPLSKAS